MIWREMPSLRPRATVLVVIGVALIVRVACALALPDRILWPDGRRYDRVARNLLEGRGFGTIRENQSTVPTLPLYLAATYAVAGHHPRAARLSQALLGALSCGLAFLIGRKLAGPGAGLLAALILVFYPYYVYIGVLFEYPTNMFITLMGLALLILLDFGVDQRPRTAFVAGALLGVAGLTIPTVLGFVPFVLLAGFVRGGLVRSQVVATLLLVTGVALPVGAWALRNYLAYDTFILVNSAGKVAFWKGNNPYFLEYREPDAPAPLHGMRSNPGDEEAVRLWESMPVVQATRDLPFHQSGDLYMAAALDFIREHPGDFVRMTAYKFVNLWRPYPKTMHKNVHTRRTSDLVGAATYIPVFLLGLIGIAYSAREWRRWLMIYFYIGALAAAYSIVSTSVRYRLPLDFVLAVFAALALTRLVETFARRRAKVAPIVST